MKKVSTILFVIGAIMLVAGILSGLLYDVMLMIALVIGSVLVNTVALTVRRGKGK